MEPITSGRSAPAYGFDAVHVPRCRLDMVGASGAMLDIRSAGLQLELPVGPELAARTQALLGGLQGSDE